VTFVQTVPHHISVELSMQTYPATWNSFILSP